MEFAKIANQASHILAALEPILTAAVPPAGAAIAIASKIAAGVVEAEPAAVALYEQITSGEIPTEEQMLKYAADYEESYQALHVELAKLTK